MFPVEAYRPVATPPLQHDADGSVLRGVGAAILRFWGHCYGDSVGSGAVGEVTAAAKRALHLLSSRPTAGDAASLQELEQLFGGQDSIRAALSVSTFLHREQQLEQQEEQQRRRHQLFQVAAALPSLPPAAVAACAAGGSSSPETLTDSDTGGSSDNDENLLGGRSPHVRLQHTLQPGLLAGRLAGQICATVQLTKPAHPRLACCLPPDPRLITQKQVLHQGRPESTAAPGERALRPSSRQGPLPLSALPPGKAVVQWQQERQQQTVPGDGRRATGADCGGSAAIGGMDAEGEQGTSTEAAAGGTGSTAPPPMQWSMELGSDEQQQGGDANDEGEAGACGRKR